MTIDVATPSDTSSLIQPIQPTLYPVRIDLQHRQLKHRICTRDADVLYYSSSHEIYAVHLNSRKRELVRSLAWPPQCLDAGHGWIVAGGSKRGQCAFIRIVNDQRHRWAGSGLQNDARDRTAPESDPTSRSLIHQGLYYPNYTTAYSQKYTLHYYELGTDIVNSVNLYNMKSTKKGTEDEMLVITTNNDQTVRIFSLSQFKPLTSLHYPTKMNHASMTPDGSVLLAVGDSPQAFFHRRVYFENVSAVGDKTFSTYGWESLADLRLPKTPSNDTCFTTSFSPSGHRCAVASEGGNVTVYSTARVVADMDPDDAVVFTFKTLRSLTYGESAGSVRSLDFSPAPWDLLVWAEDQGQVSIVDLREPPVSKQTLDLTTESSGVILADLDDHSNALEQRQLEIERRFLDTHRAALEAQIDLAASTDTADYADYARSRPRVPSSTIADDSYSQRADLRRLTESEQRMLESLGLPRPRIGDPQHPSSVTAPISVNYGTSNRNMADGYGPYSTNLPAISPLTNNNIPANTQNRAAASIAEYMRQRNLERARPAERTHQPRRRTSIVISNSNAANNVEDRYNRNSTLAPAVGSTMTLSTSPSHMSSSNTSNTDETSAIPNQVDSTSVSRNITPVESSEAWQTINEAFTATYTDPPQPITPSRARRAHASARLSDSQQLDASPGAFERLRDQMGVRASPTLQQLMARNEHNRNQMANSVQRLRQLQTAMANHGRGLPNALYEDLESEAHIPPRSREGGVPVLGVGWSADGRNLYVGTEQGILEYSVNVRHRMQWPGETFV